MTSRQKQREQLVDQMVEFYSKVEAEKQKAIDAEFDHDYTNINVVKFRYSECYYSPAETDANGDQWRTVHLDKPTYKILLNMEKVDKILTEDDWRKTLTLRQSQGWVHVGNYHTEPHILVFKKEARVVAQN